jgi:photosystem II stability/assembly factor-like uncharacterized protein
MKTYIAFAFLVFFASLAPAQDQTQNQLPQGTQGWSQQTIGTSLQVSTVFFINRDTGWAGAGDGTFATYDGGNSWIIINPLRIHGQHFVDANNGWAVSDTSIVRTSNGGKDWQPVQSPILGRIQTFGMDTIYIYNSILALFARSSDGGNTWKDTSVVGASGPEPMSFANSEFGFIGGDKIVWSGSPPPKKGTFGAGFTITTNGGITWTQKYCQVQERIDEIYALDSNTIFASAGTTNSVNMVHSNDGGNTWDTVKTGQWAQNYFFLNKKIGYAVGGNIIQLTNDSGKTWILQNSTVTTSLFSIFFIDSLTGWASGDNGVVLHTTNGGTSYVAQNPSLDTLSIQTFPDPVTASTINFQYTLPVDQHVSLTLYDLLGQSAQILLQNDLETQGVHTLPFTLANLPNGSYYYVFLTEQYQSSGKITIIH